MYYKKFLIQIEELNRSAYLYVGLPENYDTTQKKYPVLYMNDGHNVFCDEDSYSGVSWGLIKAYENNPNLPEIIVVGLQCAVEGLERFNEYCPYDIKFPAALERSNNMPIGGKGDLYLNYIINTLKPRIDAEYRTLKTPEHTAIMGSSMGGVISMHAALKHNNIFSRAASLSGSFFVALESMLNSIEEYDLSNINKLYIDAGTKEIGLGKEQDYINSNKAIFTTLSKKLDKDKLYFQLITDGIHHESHWSQRLPYIIQYLFSDIC